MIWQCGGMEWMSVCLRMRLQIGNGMQLILLSVVQGTDDDKGFFQSFFYSADRFYHFSTLYHKTKSITLC